ncbi:hypothetical protein GCM10011322_20190 [Salinarimonas ramus]|uniref:Uncharacterized protein n=2 Tax=Salinarimonas ramus TaxID=690164 RepID=A0A917V408_9HYPH|nr:hypothetical protein GCM10011322_20190 [Salinarimonas ramus]
MLAHPRFHKGSIARAAAASALLLLATLPTTAAKAATLDDLAEAEAALVAVWEELPLTFRTATFVSERPVGFGVYEARETSVFAPGERLVVYAEPQGYLWEETGDGRVVFGFDVDLLIKRPDGEIVGGRENFQRLALESRERNREFMLTLTLTLDGIRPGDYVLEYRARDIASDKAGTIALPFTIAAE